MLGIVFREDYLLRLIDQLAVFLCNVSGLNNLGEHEKALAEADQAWSRLLEGGRVLVDAFDTPTLAAMLRDPAKLRVAAQLLQEEGRALAGAGDPQSAAVRYRRALELMLELRATDREDRDRAAIAVLAQRVPASTMAPRYRNARLTVT